jgi:hypothetical protein
MPAMLGIQSLSQTIERRTGDAIRTPARTKSPFAVFPHPIPFRV